MRVLYLTMNPDRASTTVPTEGWFRFLRPRGLEPVLVSHEIGRFHHWASEQGIPAWHVPLPFPNKWHPLRFARSLMNLRRIVKRQSIQLIHCNEENVFPIGQYLGRLCHLPVVVSCHFRMSRGFCTWAFGGSRCPLRIFFVSQSCLEACKSVLEGIVPEQRWKVVHNGLDMIEYRCDTSARAAFRRQWGLESDILVGTGCAFRPRKQLEHFIEVAARIDLPNVKFLLAGFPIRGEEEYAQHILKTAESRLGKRFIFVGHLTDMRPFCNALDLFINTSQEESFGISVLEALACGTPVVGYPSVSVQEVVLPGGGEIVEQDRIDKLTDTLTSWLNDPLRITAARAEARRRAEEGFNIRKISDQLWHEYESLIN